ncbi:unnamed protein product [Arabis nemorensis]|uniref:Ubiquitin-like protease family profile domain-containing protein n=1 Tax=Arabis nemorensis TaxID=586526 RepID=A0A565CA22_9BRAS|nr:unnamed protein product [Arabis nemorensis]
MSKGNKHKRPSLSSINLPTASDSDSPVAAEAEPLDDSHIIFETSDKVDRWAKYVGVQKITKEISNTKAGTSSLAGVQPGVRATGWWPFLGNYNLEGEFQSPIYSSDEEPYLMKTKTSSSLLSLATLFLMHTSSTWQKVKLSLEIQHMQVIMSMLWRRRAAIYAQDRVVLIDPWFTTLISSTYNDFKGYPDPATFSWGINVKVFVSDNSTGKQFKTEFLKNVDVVYISLCFWQIPTGWVLSLISL